MDDIRLRNWCFIDNPYKEDYENEKALYIFFYKGEQLCRIIVWEYELNYFLSISEVIDAVVIVTNENAQKNTIIKVEEKDKVIPFEEFFEKHFTDQDAYKIITHLVSKNKFSKLKNNKMKF